MSAVIHINGWPGCGKLTIGRLLAPLLDARLVDNHTVINPAEALLGRDDPLYWPLRLAVRATVMDYAARMPTTRRLIFTDAMSTEPSDLAYFDAYPALAAQRGVSLVCVLLTIDAEENARRIVSPGRGDQRKLSTREMLDELRGPYQLLRGPNLIELDVTALTAEQAAAQLARDILACE